MAVHTRFYRTQDLDAQRLVQASEELARELSGSGVRWQFERADEVSMMSTTAETLVAAVGKPQPFRFQITIADADAPLLRVVRDEQRLRVELRFDNDQEAERALDRFSQSSGLTDAGCLALALSGGGFRATLFHLGLVRFLLDSGCLADVTHIYSVSGGSVMAAHLVRNWDRYLDKDRFDQAAAELIAFTQRDVRGRVFRWWILWALIWWWSFPFRWLLGLRGNSLGHLFGLDWTGFGRTGLLEWQYRYLLGDASLRQLPETAAKTPPPELHMLATGLRTGAVYSFSHEGVAVEDPVGAGTDAESAAHVRPIGGATIRVAQAVTASSAFPPAFPPVRLDVKTLRPSLGELQRFHEKKEFLSDGGVFDNLGIFKFLRQQARNPTHFRGVIISDAGAPLTIDLRESYDLLVHRAVRATEILMNRVSQSHVALAEKSQQKQDDTSAWQTPITCLRISDSVDYPLGLDRHLQKHACQIRTDLDAFEPFEARLLIAHGYGVARAATKASEFFDDNQWREVRARTRRPWLPEEPESGNQGEDRPHAIDTLNAGIEEIESKLKRRQTVWWFTWMPLFLSRRQPLLCAVNIALFLLWVFLLSGVGVYVRYRNDIWFAEQVKQKYDPWHFRISYRNPSSVWDELVTRVPELKAFEQARDTQDCEALIRLANKEGFGVLVSKLRSDGDAVASEEDGHDDDELARILYYFLRLRKNWITLGYSSSESREFGSFRKVFKARVQVVKSDGKYYLTGFVEDFYFPEHERSWARASLDRIAGRPPPAEVAIHFVGQAPTQDNQGPLPASLTLIQHVKGKDARIHDGVVYSFRPGEWLRGTMPHSQLLPDKGIVFAKYEFWPRRE